MKKIKSVISIFLVSTMLFAVAAAGIGSASAAETFVESIYHYTVTDGKATITDVVGAGTEVTVPATLGGYPVTAIGERAFREEGTLRNVIIPASVETIGKSAFIASIALETVTFADNSPVKELPETTFQNCKSLKTVNFGNNSTLETVGRAAFVGCSALENFNPPASLKTIGANAFENCVKLNDVTITKNVATIGDGAFAKCEALEKFNVDAANANFSTDSWGILYNKDKTAIIAYPAGNKRPVYTIPAYITRVEDSAFMGAVYLEDISWLNPHTNFGLSAFSYCTSLYRATVPEGTTQLYDWMFNACFSLTEVNLPDSLFMISAGTFHWCTGLESIVIPEGLDWIGPNAFKECYNLKSVVLPSTVTEIGSNAFSRCFSLKEINIPESVGVIGQTAFYQCYSLKEFTFPESVRNANSEVLRYCLGLETVNFSSDMLSIDDFALMDCRKLETVNIPASVNDIEGASFVNCINLKSVNIDSDNRSYKTGADGVVYYKNGKRLVYYPAAKDGSVFVVPESVTSIGGYAFASAQNLTTVVIHSGVTHVQATAFDGYNIRDIYFEGTQEQWNAFQVASSNAVKNATVHFNHTDADHVHDYTQTLTTVPTCEKMGQKLFTCSCGASVTKEWHYASSKMLCSDGNYVLFDGPDSNCTEKGKSMFGCTECAKIFDTVDKAKIAHDFEISVSATQVGYRCKDCNHTYNEPVPEGAKYAAFVYADTKRVYILNPGEKLGYPVTPVKDGLEFAYWVDESGTKVDTDVMPDRNVVLQPFFEKHMSDDVYNVTVKFDEDCFAEGYDVDLVIDEVSNNREQGAILYKENNATYSAIRLLDIAFKSGNSEIQPQSGKSVEICIPVPKGYEHCEEFLICHRHGGAEYDSFVVIPVNGMLIFTADRFSEFEIYAKASLIIETLPAKLSYAYKEALDLSGLSLCVIDEGGNAAEVTDTSKIKVSGYDSGKTGNQTVTVEYDGLTAEFTVKVEYTWWQWIIRILLLGFLWY